MQVHRERYPRVEARRIYLWNLRPDHSGLSPELAAYLARFIYRLG